LSQTRRHHRLDESNEDQSDIAQAVSCPGFVPACCNFSVQYNYHSASIAAAVMLPHNDITGDGVKP
ncbi:unnamed protein product, partial [Polarella glacialis]